MLENSRSVIHFTTHLFKKHFSIFIVLYFITLTYFQTTTLQPFFTVYLIQIISCIESTLFLSIPLYNKI